MIEQQKMYNYRLRTYIKKNERYDVLEKHKDESNKYNGKEMDVSQMTFYSVKMVMKALGNISSWDSIKNIFEICFNVKNDNEWFYDGRVLEFFEARNYIINKFTELIQQEQQLLKSKDELNAALWKQAGGEKLNRFGGILALNQLGKLYGQYPFDLQSKKYMEILLLLTVEKETNEITQAYNKLKAQFKKK